MKQNCNWPQRSLHSLLRYTPQYGRQGEHHWWVHSLCKMFFSLQRWYSIQNCMPNTFCASMSVWCVSPPFQKNLALHDQLSPCCTYKHGAGKHCLQRWPPTIGPPHESMQLHQEGKSKIAIYFPTPPNPARNSSITAANIQAEQYFSHHAVGLDKITAAPILQLRLPIVSDHMHSDHSENGICAVSRDWVIGNNIYNPTHTKKKLHYQSCTKNKGHSGIIILALLRTQDFWKYIALAWW